MPSPVDDLARDFAEWWTNYPQKIAKLAAEKAYRTARKRATAAELLTGVENYNQHLPDDPQFICRATSFLNQGRWMDEYDVPAQKQPPVDFDWYVQCAKLHGGECGGDRMRHHVRMSIEKAS